METSKRERTIQTNEKGVYVPLSRWSSRHEKTFGKKRKEKWNGDFRKPPKPKHYYTKTKGNCRWCGNVILNDKEDTINTRKSWHEDCATEYLLIYHSGEQRAQLSDRDWETLPHHLQLPLVLV